MIIRILEHCADLMVLKEAGYDRDVCVWGGVCGHENYHGDPRGNKV